MTRDGNNARVSVTDNGPGIPPEFHERIFEKFGQVESQQRKSGTGLGLTFCKLAVEAHGGQIGVYNLHDPAAKPDHPRLSNSGVTFWFTLPIDAQPLV